MKRNTRFGKSLRSILAPLLFFPGFAGAQISITTLAAPVNALSITDLDFLNSTTPKWLFTINMSAPGRVDAIMTINLDVELAAGSSYSSAAQFISKVFSINGSRTVTNLELGKGKPIPDSMYIFNQSAKAAFQDVALPSGAMPAGSYTFHVDVRTADGSSGDTRIFTFVLSNPSTPILMAPTDGETVVEEFPLFEWQYDGPRATIAIFEQLSGQQSLEEIASGTPQLTATVSTRSFRYPPTGARALQPGKRYVWYVTGLVGVAGGTSLQLRSQPRSFTVSTSRRNSIGWLLQELESTLPTTWKPVFDQIRADGLSPSGTYRFNGAPISLTDLLKVLNEIRSNPESVSAVNLE
ncbi:MAG: hypothetical protein ABI623_01190 [bacterium]